jgi:CRISPR-associated protein Cas1
MRSLHFIEDPGLWLSVRAGELAVRLRDGRYVHLEERVRTIVALAHGFCITSAAIKYCSAKHIEVLISDDAATFVSLFAPTSATNSSRAALRIRERQFKAAFNPERTFTIAHKIVATKIKAEGHSSASKQCLLAALRSAKTVDDVRHIEAKAAQVFWRQFAGFEMRFDGPAVPIGWRVFQSRYIGRPQGRLGELAAQFTPRNAIHPMQALQNFAVAIAVARMTRVIIAHGLDPCFGFLHDGRKPGRMSLVWDAVEPLRPAIVSAVFGYVAEHIFEKKDFIVFIHKISSEKTVRLAPNLAKEIAALTAKTISVRECVRMTNWLAKLF